MMVEFVMKRKDKKIKNKSTFISIILKNANIYTNGSDKVHNENKIKEKKYYDHNNSKNRIIIIVINLK